MARACNTTAVEAESVLDALAHLYISESRVTAFVRVEFVWSSVDSIHSVRFGQLLRCAQKRVVNYVDIMKVYMERKKGNLN